jgi:NAD(P)-dependent dehydrogenase (short-subunit alcohol dehydrogenase family)
MSRSFVVTGGARGVGGAIAERLSQEGAVVVVDRVAADGFGGGIRAIVGDAADDAVLGRAVQIAAASGTLSGWVNNAPVFRDAALHEVASREIVALIAENVALAVAGASAAVRRFIADGTPGAIVNVSSHQATRDGARRAPVRDGQGGDRGAHAGRSRGCTRSAAPDRAPRSPRWSPTCSRRPRASSTAR